MHLFIFCLNFNYHYIPSNISLLSININSTSSLTKKNTSTKTPKPQTLQRSEPPPSGSIHPSLPSQDLRALVELRLGTCTRTALVAVIVQLLYVLVNPWFLVF
jgi:hypothetical protein